MLRGDQGKELCERVWGLVGQAMQVRDRYVEQVDGDGEEVGLKIPGSVEEMLDLIDLGQKGGIVSGNTGVGSGKRRRTWILDPIDGTKTYIRGQQYAVCLCLVEDGEQKVGVLGCPNLNLDGRNEESGRLRIEEGWVDLKGDGGWILSTIKGEGVKLSKIARPWDLLPLEDVLRDTNGHGIGDQIVNGTEEQHQRDDEDNDDDTNPTTISLRFTDSAASPHVSKDLHHRVFQHFAPRSSKSSEPSQSSQPSSSSLGLDIWSMQLKYVLLTLRAHNADALIRIPPDSDYHAAVWDHAGGQLLLTESGGVLTDAKGNAFVVDGQTRKLEGNWGVCGIRGGNFGASRGENVHGQLLSRVLEEVKERDRAQIR